MTELKDDNMVTVAAIGAGNRMNIYSALHGHGMRVVAVVDPDDARREALAARCGVADNMRFSSWDDFIRHDRCADAAIICSPDRMHFAQAVAAIERGYDVLLEKPIAQSLSECIEIADKARMHGRVVAVCHVLRHNRYFRKFKDLISNGSLGRIISINHVEAVGIERMTHSFVRGLWRNEHESNPMILSKACHDLDLLVWLTGRNCLHVSSYGSLTWFRQDNAPAGSTPRCTDGCSIEHKCPYSAIDLYYRRRRWLRHFNIPEGADIDNFILHQLRTGPYGRCVYRCDNDVVDHQVVSLLMHDGITINFSMDAFTRHSGRKTHCMMSHGEIIGDERHLTVRHFAADAEEVVYDFSDCYGETSGHGGGDIDLVRDFIKAVRSRDTENLTTNISTSIESHRIAFEIEQRRKSTMKSTVHI